MKRYDVTYNTDNEAGCCFICMADSIEDAWDLFCLEVKSEVKTSLESVTESYDNPKLGRILNSYGNRRIMIRSYKGDETMLGSEWLRVLDRSLLRERIFNLRDESSDEYDLCITLV